MAPKSVLSVAEGLWSILWPFFVYFWSLDEVVGDLRIHVHATVRTSVRHTVARKPFIFGPTPTGRIRTYKFALVSVSLSSVVVSVRQIFSETAHWNFLIFCMNASLRECKKVTFLFFQENSKIGHFGSRLTKIWAKMVKNAQNQRFSAFFRKPHIGFPLFFAWMLVLGSVKKWRFCFFWKTRKLDILGRVYPKF